MASGSAERAPGEVVVVAASGELDVASSPKFRSSVIDSLPTTSGGSDIAMLVLDLQRVDFVDSFGLGVIVGAYKRALRAELGFGVAVADGRVRDTLELVGFPRLFAVGPAVDDVVGTVPARG